MTSVHEIDSYAPVLRLLQQGLFDTARERFRSLSKPSSGGDGTEADEIMLLHCLVEDALDPPSGTHQERLVEEALEKFNEIVHTLFGERESSHLADGH